MRWFRDLLQRRNVRRLWRRRTALLWWLDVRGREPVRHQPDLRDLRRGRAKVLRGHGLWDRVHLRGGCLFGLRYRRQTLLRNILSCSDDLQQRRAVR